MDTTILQIPMQKQMRVKAVKVAEEQGFSSLQEAVRVFLNQFAMDKIQVSFTPMPIELSKQNDERYAKMLNEIKLGKVKTKTFTDNSKLMNYLNK